MDRVHIKGARRTEHNAVAACHPPGRMARGIVPVKVRFRLDNDSFPSIVIDVGNEFAAKKSPGHFFCILLIELLG